MGGALQTCDASVSVVSACAAGYTMDLATPSRRMDSGAAAMWQMPRLTPRTLWATERYDRISSELRPRSFGLPLSPTPLEAPTPTPLSISGLQSDGGSLQTEPRLQPCATYSPRWSFCQSVDRRRRGRDRRCGRPCCRAAARPAASRAPSSPADRTPAAARRSGRPSEMAML